MKKEEKSSATLADKRRKTSEKVESMKQKLAGISFSPEEFNSLENEKNNLENSVGNLHTLLVPTLK